VLGVPRASFLFSARARGHAFGMPACPQTVPLGMAAPQRMTVRRGIRLAKPRTRDASVTGGCAAGVFSLWCHRRYARSSARYTYAGRCAAHLRQPAAVPRVLLSLNHPVTRCRGSTTEACAASSWRRTPYPTRRISEEDEPPRCPPGHIASSQAGARGKAAARRQGPRWRCRWRRGRAQTRRSGTSRSSIGIPSQAVHSRRCHDVESWH
jgi:hypothetical protein